VRRTPASLKGKIGPNLWEEIFFRKKKFENDQRGSWAKVSGGEIPF